MVQTFSADVELVTRIKAVPTILEVVCLTTGMGFAAVARVTSDRWVACSILDNIGFGLTPGGELKVESTICHEIRQSRQPVVIEHVSQEEIWCNHATPALYGFQSYISVPIILADDTFFGTLCAIDPHPARLNTPETLGMFRLFAELIAKHLEAERKLAVTESALSAELAAAELREQFIAILGHDLRAPARAITSFSQLMLKSALPQDVAKMAVFVRDAALRMNELIDNMLDLTRGRLGGGLAITCDAEQPLLPLLEQTVNELRANHPNRPVEVEWRLAESVYCDRGRIAQLFCNLLNNALTYGSAQAPVRVRGVSKEGSFELSVSNSGRPIPPEVLGHLFEPFYRAGSANAREGLGLGLYIAAEIAKAHGGTLTATSTPAETCFVFLMANC